MNINRIAYLIRNEWTIKWKLYSMILVGATIYSFMNFRSDGNFLSSILGSSSSVTTTTIVNGRVLTSRAPSAFKEQLYHLDFMPTLFVLLGIVIISLVFWEYRPGSTSNFHISLPASQNEKWTSKFIFAIIIYPIVFFLAYQVYQSVTYNIALSASGQRIVTMGVFDSYRWEKMYIGILQLMTFFGLASVFRKYGFIKSIIVATLGMNMIGFIPNLIISLYHPKLLDQGILSLFSDTTSFTNPRINWTTVRSSYQPNHWLYNSILMMIPAIFSVLFSYFKFKEIEA